MTRLYHTFVLTVLLIVFFTGGAVYAQAVEASATTPSVAPSASVGQPAAAASTAAIQRNVALPSYGSWLGDFTGAGPWTESVLVIPARPVDSQAVGQMAEDLSIMSRIIEKNALDEYRGAAGAGAVNTFVWKMSLARSSPATFFAAAGRARPMYLGGYGAVFFLQVDFPLLPPPATPQDRQADQPEDPVWAQTKRDLLEPQSDVVLPQNGGEPPEPYSRDRVDALRTQLIATMKHATNIRGLEPTDWLALVVRAPGATNPGKTVMTIRATKADVDQYAKGQLSQQQFEQRLQIVTY
ncbi:MAG: hypothetical protein JW955_03530 [Sedimentisphaerales bacterium]|nr:hypothetical protein [Sedimentisphaerales bacterium]